MKRYLSILLSLMLLVMSCLPPVMAEEAGTAAVEPAAPVEIEASAEEEDPGEANGEKHADALLAPGNLSAAQSGAS